MGGNSGQARGFGGRPHSRGRRQRKFKISNFRFGERQRLTWIGLRGDIWAIYSQALHRRAQQAGAPTGRNSTDKKETDTALWNIKRGGDYEFTGAYVGGDDYSCRAGD